MITHHCQPHGANVQAPVAPSHVPPPMAHQQPAFQGDATPALQRLKAPPAASLDTLGSQAHALDTLSPASTRPLDGRRVLVTGTHAQGSSQHASVASLSAHVRTVTRPSGVCAHTCAHVHVHGVEVHPWPLHP